MLTTPAGTVVLTHREVYSAMCARLHHGDSANAVRYAKLLLTARELERVRWAWLANAIAVVRSHDPQGKEWTEKLFGLTEGKCDDATSRD